MLPLALLSEGEEAEIVVSEGMRADREERAEALGLRAGRRVEMLNNARSPVLVKVDESRIAVDRGVAMRITVRKMR